MKKEFSKIIVLLILITVSPIISIAQDMSEQEVLNLLKESNSQFVDKQYGAALDGFLRVGEITKLQRSEGERQVNVYALTMAVICYRYLRQYEKGFILADNLYKDSLSDEERDSLRSSYVMCGYMLACEYITNETQQYAESRRILNTILPFADEDMQNRIMRSMANAWYAEGMTHGETSRYTEELVCMEQAQAAFHEIGMSTNEMKILSEIGYIKQQLFDWPGSLVAYRKAESLARDDVDKMNLLAKQRELYIKLANDEEMWAISRRMDSLAFVSDDVELKFEYNKYRGDQALDYGQYRIAERWYMNNEPLLSYVSNTNSYFLHYSYLCGLFSGGGRYEEALKYALLAKDEALKGSGARDGVFYLEYGLIADIYRGMGDSLNCFKCLDTLFLAEPIIEEPRQLQYLYHIRASAFGTFGKYEKALADYQTADALLASKYDETDGDRIALLPLMGGMEHQLGHYEKSERLYRQYAERIGSKYVENSPNYVNALKYLANAEGFAGHIDSACSNYTEAASLLKRQVRSKWPYLTSQEREGYWNSTAELFLNMAPFALEAKAFQSSFTEDCYNGLILTKAFLLESEQSTFDLIKHHGTPEDLALFSSIQALYGKVQDWERNDYYTDSILQTTQTIRMLESRLADSCRAFGDATAYMDMDYRKIRQSLKDGDVLLDFTDFVSKSRGRVYAAYIVDNKQPYPLLKELFQERSIDSLEVTAPFQYYEDDCAERLVELLWKPLKEHVPEGATVYYVPTQMLFQIALESLPAGDGTLLGNHYQFVRLSSARELARYNDTMEWASSPRRADAVLYGDLQYSLDGAVMAQEARKHEVPRLLAYRGDSDVIRSEVGFNPLPGTKDEIDYIEQELKSVGLSVVPYSGKTGTEESFLCLSGQAPIILHMATHGFYYTSDAALNVDYLRGYRDAMSLSGLVLSGGNSAWQGNDLPEGVLDGIVTAADISRMDLSGVDMAVLSACHTGKGKATPEGLYGLQRAFKKASVRTIIMSLWAESDVVGPEFMAAFYKYLVEGKDKWNKRKAFDRAKTDIRNKYPKDPSLWAGFVMLD